MRILVAGWASFVDGEATAGDVLAMSRVAQILDDAGLACDQAFSPVFRPGSLSLDQAAPEAYSHLVFVCGPAHGAQVRALHRRYARCRRIAVGVSVIDPADDAVTGFDRVLARDGAGAAPDLCFSAAPPASVPVLATALAPGQAEYGARGRHGPVHEALGEWLLGLDAARVPIDTRLDSRDWRQCATPDQFAALVARFDVLVTSRLHGLVFGLRAGVPVLAVDPVGGGGKVAAQASTLGWPGVVTADELVGPGAAPGDVLDRWWAWCRSERARALARSLSDQSLSDRPLSAQSLSDRPGEDGLEPALLAVLRVEVPA
ncbi:polysaccharide pyruvyl transferase family protein [Pseudonocardia sp. KRD291]|uniref:polysaccharide pyruvyl transferase family protein n=1 Tax=Pseudonocardia sp. KRD291 TaxID=2792007 RepID=UPI001C49F7B8|nr:polysaccharide pyruvyl transferase family protein [Pseudonocardia sp. KRD291]MBW0101313.1 polysaccharide pyruvyl transferase family protein [Pseudonocardia sp. KRD291]